MAEPIPFPQELLERAHSPSTAASHYTERVIKRPLYVRPTSPVPSARALRRRALNERQEKARKRSKLKPRPLSAAKKRALGLLEIPNEQQKYAIYEGLHRLWTGYMRDVLGLNAERTHVTAASAGQILASADMHGAILEVVRSRCVSRVGLKGIVVRDTKFTFEIITDKNVVKSVPKEHTMFRFEVPLTASEGEEAPKPLLFEILGEQFQARAPDRANKKFRMHYQPDI
ncbi:ribonuclease-like protein P complex subunit Pop4 [Trematosphaeria pertusa]|uniref:Ribonuclease P protein subunit n=1 Tax=Trematosphaeria pertusa TaxID=390896 RepID=A0A6A6IF25_9PLEO|nr:ribonuclease-like protein P complex subunit Pop4 [Trematosphaeria pertusa]KAF2248678.1 ribonuclease-like protein P complex subunit Pop4 [Trematosphaeria pertusa]